MTSAPLSCPTCDKLVTDEEHAWVAKWVDERVVAFQQSGGDWSWASGEGPDPKWLPLFCGHDVEVVCAQFKDAAMLFQLKTFLRPSAA